MNPHSLKSFLLIPTIALTGLLTGCLNDRTVVNTAPETGITETAADPRVNFLVKEADIKRELIHVKYDSLTRDTAYILEPPLTIEQKKKGMRGTGIGFKASHLDKIMKDAAERQVQKAVAGPSRETSRSGLLVKTAQTRWDHWYAPIDVKNLTEVRNVKVYIHKSGPAGMGSNWVSAVRSAIANWNAQSKGSAVSFVETMSEAGHDISVRGTYGIGSDGSLSSTVYLTADRYMKPDGISLYVNTAYESNSTTPHNQKTTVAMSMFALSTNITFTGMEGYYWNNGTSIHIPGTPSTDGDGFTPGSSILTYGTTSVSTPVMTAGDIKAFRSIYPSFGDLSLSVSGILPGIDNSVAIFQVSTDTVHYLRTDKKLFRRIGAGANVQIWPGTGSYGDPVQFLYSKGYLAVRTNSGRIYTRTPTGNWINQTPTYAINPSDFRLDGNRLTVAIPSRTELRSYYLGPTSASTQVLDWYMANGAITDWQIRNGLLVVVNAGTVYAMQDYLGWHTLHTPSSGPAHHIQLSDQKMAMFYTPIGSPYSSVAVRHGMLSGWWSYYSDPVYHQNDIHLCGDKLAFLQQTNYLRVIDYSTSTVHEHYSMPTGTEFKHTKLSGPNCDFVTSISHWGPALWAKYGVDLDNQYMTYAGAVQKISQGAVPDL